MIYTQEVLNRATGDLKTETLGEWITVTELGQRYGVSERRVRAVLYHMGLLAPEGAHGRYRLPFWAVERGLGKRIKPKKSKWPFDVLSPSVQALIAAVWDETVHDLGADTMADSGVHEASLALERLRAERGDRLTTQGEVLFLRYKFNGITNSAIAQAIGVSLQLVGRYAGAQDKQLAKAREKQAHSSITTEEDIRRLERWAKGE